MDKLKTFVNSILNFFGFQLIAKRNRNFDAIYLQIYSLLETSPSKILDVGGHNGSSIERFRRIWPTIAIHSFEPNPMLFEEMQSKFLGESSIELNKLGVSNHPGRLQFNIHSTSTGSSSILSVDQDTEFSRRRGIRESTVSTVEIEVTTLDTYLGTNGSADVLKIDVQGYEFEVLQGAQNTLKSGKLDFIEVELIVSKIYFHEKNWTDTVKLLSECGFSVMAISTDARGTNLGPFDLLQNAELQFDFLFGRDEVIEQIKSKLL